MLLAACGGGSGGGSGAATGNAGSGGAGAGNADGSNGNAAGGGAYQAGPGPQGGAALYADFRAGKKLILDQRGAIALTPGTLRDRLAVMDATLEPFDGVFLRLPTTGKAIAGNSRVGADAIAGDLAPLYALKATRLKYNFAVVKMQHDLDAFDDWSTVLANFTALARVARDAGLVGIVIDNEGITDLRVNFPYDVKQPGKTLEEYRARMQQDSKQVMQAIAGEFPDAVVVVLRGAAGAEPKSPVNIVNAESESAQLLGSFFAGFVEGKGARSLVVDGGTDFGLRTSEQFAASRDWRRNGLASTATDSAFLSTALRGAWPAGVDVSFGVRELDGAHANLLPNMPELWTSTLIAALRNADTFVWASFDLTDLSKAPASEPFLVAAKRARASAATAGGVHLWSAAPASGTGLMAQYFAKADESELAQTSIDAFIDFVWSDTGPVNTVLDQLENYSVIWSGYLEAPTTGAYTLYGTTDDGMQISIDGKPVVDSFFDQAPTEHAGTIDLVAGTRYPIKVRWFQHGGGAEAHVWWMPPGGFKEVIPVERLYPYY